MCLDWLGPLDFISLKKKHISHSVVLYFIVLLGQIVLGQNFVGKLRYTVVAALFTYGQTGLEVTVCNYTVKKKHWGKSISIAERNYVSINITLNKSNFRHS